jgi:hypothetical protein
MQLYEQGDLAGLRELVHEDAEIQMVLLGGEVARGPSGLERALRQGEESLHQPYGTRVEPIDDHACVLVGRVRYSLEGGGYGDRAAAWLSVVKDGKMWRTYVYDTAEQAREAYATEFASLLRPGQATGA